MTETALPPWADPSATPLITFENVRKDFGDVTAISDLTLNIYPGEFFALLGPSGCGKTTLMRMLAGFEHPTQGRVTLNGQDLAGQPAHGRPVNMMFQSYALFPHMSVWDNIAFGLRRDGVDGDALHARVEEMLRLVQMSKFAKRKPDQLSGGQKQRVALARSLAKAPKVLLLDEPLGALDKKLRQETQFELVDIQEKTGTTFVIVTHDQEEAMTVSTRIAVMDEGEIRQVDTPEGIYERPQNRYVADFVGDVNLFEGTWIDAAVVLPGQAAVFAADGTAGHGQTMWLAVRPEKIAIGHTATDHVNRIQGKVIDIAYSGNLSTYVVEIAGGQRVKAQRTNRDRGGANITWNDQVWLSWPRSAGLVLTE
ncbi:MAG: ABC transporter ATP-binding protein [Planktomarina sp.]